jgi:hypothetical protein
MDTLTEVVQPKDICAYRAEMRDKLEAMSSTT